MKYRQLTKGKRYAFKYKRQVRSGEYRGRFYNPHTRAWHYNVCVCVGMYFCPPAPQTEVWEL